MKLLLSILLLFSCQIEVFGQEDHHSMEAFMQDKLMRDFKSAIHWQPADNQDKELTAFIYNKYNQFVDSVHVLLENNPNLNEDELEFGYTQLVKTTGELLRKMRKDQKDVKPGSNGPSPKLSTCSVLGFESGNLTGWELLVGDVPGTAPFSYSAMIGVPPGSHHAVLSSGFDPITGLPCVSPQGGNYSVLLGNNTGTGAEAAQMSYSFTVSSTTSILQYHYAVVFQSPLGHSASELPYFTARVLDNAGNILPCSEYAVYADSTTAMSFEQTSTNVLYSNWETVIVNLSAYVGQSVTLEFTAGDCSLGGHYGYAYVDAICGVAQSLVDTVSICSGVPPLLTAPSGVGAYMWSTGDTTQSILGDTPGTYTCTLTPYQAGACDFDVTFIVEEHESPTADFTQFPDSICPGESITFFDQSSVPSPQFIEGYEWNFDGVSTQENMTGTITGVPNTTGSYDNPTHTFNNAGTLDVALIVTSSGCMDTTVNSVVVLPPPTVNAGFNQAFCDTATVTLSGIVSGAVSSQWNNGVLDGVPFQQVPSLVWYTLTAENALGCSSSDSMYVFVHPLPDIDAGPDQQICEGEQVLLSATGTGSFSWDNGVSDSIPFTPVSDTMTFTVVATSSNGCINSDQVTVITNPLPIVEAGNDQVECEGTPIVLNGSGSPNAVWTNGVINNTSFLQDVGVVTYVLNDTLPTGCFASDSLTIEILPNPVFNFEDTSLCFGDSAIYTGNPIYSYSWTGGIVDNVFFTPVQTNSYIVTVTEANGCSLNDTVTVTVFDNPIVDFTILDTNLTTFNPVTGFDNLSTGASFYEWNFGDGSDISNEFEPTHEFPYQYAGTYDILLTGYSEEGCMDTARKSVTVLLEQSIFVPNSFTPDGDEYNQVFKPIVNGYDTEDYVLYIYNRWGELIFETHDVNVGWDGMYSQHNFQVQDGIYTWKIELGLLDSADKEVFHGHVTILR